MNETARAAPGWSDREVFLPALLLCILFSAFNTKSVLALYHENIIKAGKPTVKF